MKTCYVKDLSDHISIEITDQFILKCLNNNLNGNGVKWSDCIFSDTTGNVKGIIWSESMQGLYQSYIGKVVNVQGVILLRDGEPYIQAVKLDLVEPIDYKPEDFIYQLDNELFNIYKQSIKHYIESIENLTIKGILLSIYTDKMFNCMKNLPAGINYHHIYNGGLLEHILEVTKIAESLYNVDIELGKHKSSYQSANRDLVIGGSLLHDIGKIFEYIPFPLGEGFTPKSKLTGFIVEGNNLLVKAYSKLLKTMAPEECMLSNLQHILATSHATKKSQVPRTKEAIMVAAADLASTNIDAYDTSFYQHELKHPNNKDTEVYSQYFGYSLLRL